MQNSISAYETRVASLFRDRFGHQPSLRFYPSDGHSYGDLLEVVAFLPCGREALAVKGWGEVGALSALLARLAPDDPPRRVA